MTILLHTVNLPQDCEELSDLVDFCETGGIPLENIYNMHVEKNIQFTYIQFEFNDRDGNPYSGTWDKRGLRSIQPLKTDPDKSNYTSS